MWDINRKRITPGNCLAQEMRRGEDETVSPARTTEQPQRKSDPWIGGQERLWPVLVLTVSKFSKSNFCRARPLKLIPKV